MSIPIHREPDSGPPVERCCFCREKTKFWTSLTDRKAGQQVACCERCSRYGSPSDVPSKESWCRRERIASPRVTDPYPLPIITEPPTW